MTETEQCMTEAQSILKPKTPTEAEVRDPFDAQLIIYDAGLELFVQVLLEW